MAMSADAGNTQAPMASSVSGGGSSPSMTRPRSLSRLRSIFKLGRGDSESRVSSLSGPSAQQQQSPRLGPSNKAAASGSTPRPIPQIVTSDSSSGGGDVTGVSDESSYFSERPVVQTSVVEQAEGKAADGSDDDDGSRKDRLEAKRNMASSLREDITRRLRRVSSAPNSNNVVDGKPSPRTPGAGPAIATIPERTSVVADASAPQSPRSRALTTSSLTPPTSSRSAGSDILTTPLSEGASVSSRQSGSGRAFRRTYSSNSIKVHKVQVGPESFEKIKLLGKGDVGKVYLVKEKRSSRLFAMKGRRGETIQAKMLTTSAEQR